MYPVRSVPLIILLVLAGCSVEPTSEPVTASASAIDTSVGAEGVLAALEYRLMSDGSLAFDFEISSSGAVSSALSGRLDARWPDVELAADGEFAGRPADLGLASTGDDLTCSNGEATTAPRPAELRDAIVIGLTRMGLLHNLAVLTGGRGPDHAGGGVREWVESRDVAFAETDDDTTVVLEFAIRVAGADSGTARLELDRATGLPRRREQTVQFPQGEMRVVEIYRF